MKISRREKNLLVIVLILGFLFVWYQFIFLPQQKKLVEVQEMNEIKKIELENFGVQSENSLNNQINEERKKLINYSDNIFGDIQQEDIILILDELWTKNNINIKAVIFTEPQVGIDSLEENSEEEKDVKLLSMQIDFECDYDSIIGFLHDANHYDKEIVVSSLTINNKELEFLTGNMILDIYYVPFINKYVQAKESRLKDNLVKKSIQYNPFKLYTSLNTGDMNSTNDYLDINLQQLEENKLREYIVKPGDTLFGISKFYYDDFRKMDQIIQYNNIQDPSIILVGQKLFIPNI